MDPSEVKEEFERTRIAEKDAIAILLQAEKIRELFPGRTPNDLTLSEILEVFESLISKKEDKSTSDTKEEQYKLQKYFCQECLDTFNHLVDKPEGECPFQLKYKSKVMCLVVKEVY